MQLGQTAQEQDLLAWRSEKPQQEVHPKSLKQLALSTILMGFYLLENLGVGIVSCKSSDQTWIISGSEPRTATLTFSDLQRQLSEFKLKTVLQWLIFVLPLQTGHSMSILTNILTFYFKMTLAYINFLLILWNSLVFGEHFSDSFKNPVSEC